MEIDDRLKNMKNPASAGRRQLSVTLSRYREIEISEGRLKPGERIPSESQLTERFGVSRNVVREAVAGLKSDGLVESYQGAGAFVSEKAHRRSFRIDQDELSSMPKLRQLYERSE